MKETDPYRINDVGFFRLAKRISILSDHRVRVGAVLCNKKPVSMACNSHKTHPIHANPYSSIRGSIHAEVRAIMNCECNPTGGTIYVYRQLKNGHPAMARPCKYCLTKLKEYGIKVMYYTINTYPFYKMEIL